jgi:hypothetical protein
MNLDYPPGATPLDPDEAAGLIPSHIANHGQLNEWEMVNIIEGERWAFGRRHKNLLSNEFVCALHKRMFGKTWRWAGKFRTTEKNIGVDPLRIQPALHDLCEDVKTQLECKSYPLEATGWWRSIPSRTETAACRGPWRICCWRSTARRVSPGARGTWLRTAKCGSATWLRFARRMRRTTARCWRLCARDRVFG